MQHQFSLKSLLLLLFQGCTFLLLSHYVHLGSCNEQQQRQLQQLSEQDDNNLFLRLNYWSRGAFDIPQNVIMQNDIVNNRSNNNNNNDNHEKIMLFKLLRHGPVRNVRQHLLRNKNDPNCEVTGYCTVATTAATILRGGSGSGEINSINNEEEKIKQLGIKYGQDFLNAIERNIQEHEEDCRKSCEIYYCANPETPLIPLNDILANNQTTIKAYSMGSVPPEDFAQDFGFPLDTIKVTENKPLFSATEAASVIQGAEDEGVDKNEFKSGKYQLAGDWLTNLPNTRQWFNERLETTFFPLLTHLFPEIITSPSVLRAHSVSLLKYNASHPRTDVHIDNGILAMTLAMTPSNQYVGGGTYFEHFGVDNILPMNVGHGTFRPGSVRHGGHRVTDGTRYILGAFLLLQDKVEHVRRLKNQGSALRRAQDLQGAAQHFEWALAMNPMCTTCLKDLAEVLHAQKDFVQAEIKIRQALTLLENKDSDALFTLGILLSEQGKDEESIQAYQQSIELNAEDAELCYNLGIKLGAKGLYKDEMIMYAKATKADPKFGGAWLNWGTVLAEQGNMDDAELMFRKALGCSIDVKTKALMNLGLVYHTRANQLAQSGDLPSAKQAAIQAGQYVDTAKPLLDDAMATTTTTSSSTSDNNNDIVKYIDQYKPLRLQCHRLVGQLLAATGDLVGCEMEFQIATQNFPMEKSAWQMLGRVLELQGKVKEMENVMAKIQSLQ